MTTRRYYSAAAMAWFGGVIGAAPATAWLWGDQSTAAREEGPTYVAPPPPIPEEVVLIAGILGILIITAVGIVIHEFPITYNILGVTALAGIILGGIYRVFTADVIGANIGAGLALLFVVPFAGLLVAVGAVLVFTLRPKRSRVADQTSGSLAPPLDEPRGAP